MVRNPSASAGDTVDRGLIYGLGPKELDRIIWSSRFKFCIWKSPEQRIVEGWNSYEENQGWNPGDPAKET